VFVTFEWRIFYTDQAHDPWNIEQDAGKELKKWLLTARKREGRRDYYYDLQEFSLGLKERWIGDIRPGNPPFLELKVRQKQEGEVELWDKCLRKRVYEPVEEEQGLSLEMVKTYLRDELENPGPRSEKYTKQIKATLAKIAKGLPTRIRVAKRRQQVRIIYSTHTEKWHRVIDEGDYRNLIQVEQTELAISRGTDDKPSICKTVCVEGRELALVEQFRDTFILQGAGLVAGYPEFLADIRRP
jgi:hypothetical protein